MAISSSTRKAGPFIGNDATTVFPFAFKVFTSADLRVVRTNALGVESDLVLDTDYTVTLNSNQDNDPGGTVTRATALPTGERLTITSDVEALQPLVLTNNGGFYPRVINDAFDKITIIAQQLVEQVGRSLKLPISSTASPTLPDPIPNGILAWNSGASGFVNVDPTDLATVAGYADARVETFNGDGTETEFEIVFNPGVLANLDISISGVTQVAGVDFTWIGTTVTFTAAPPAGTVIQVRYARPLTPMPNFDNILTAVGDAETAQTNAETAQTAASSHATDAETAQAAAEAAQTAAESAQALAEAEAALIVAQTFDVNTRFAEQSLQTVSMVDDNGLTVSARAGGIGEAFAADFTTQVYSHGLSRIPFLPTMEFTRSGTGVAVGGGETETFAEDTPRILDRLFLDAGGTNLLTAPDDFSNAAWTKTNVGTPSAADGPGGVGSAWQMLETSATGAHSVGQVKTGLAALTRAMVAVLVKVTGRDHLQFDLYNQSTSEGVRSRFSLLGGGSLVSPYPAALGASPTGLGAGIIDYGGGYWLLWQTVLLSASTTGLRPSLALMSNSTTTSYAGDTAKGFSIEGMWALDGVSLPVNFLTGTRAAETLNVPLGKGNYLARRVDGEGEVIEALQIADVGDRWTLAPRDGSLWLEEAQAYTLQCYDTVTRANTSSGDLGTATDGGTYDLLKYPGSFPMIAAVNGFVLDNTFAFTPSTAASFNGAVYAVRSVGGPITRYISAEISWTADSGSSSNTSAALLTSNDKPNLTSEMPIHAVFGRTQGTMQFRSVADGFVTLGEVKPAEGSLARDGTWYQALVAIQGNRAKFTWAGFTIIVQSDKFLEDAEFACWELFSTFAFGSNTDRVRMRNLLASQAEVGPALEYTAAAPVNVVLPFALGTAVAGNTYSASSTQGGWTSNDGPIVYTYQWQFDGVDIPGATNATLVTVNGVDEGKTVSVRVIATNDTGSTSATSLPSAALA